MLIYPLTTTSDSSTVTASAAAIGGGAGATALLVGQTYLYVSNTNSWIRQGSCKLVTCVTKANFADTDFFTITVAGIAVVYEFDKAGDGVTTGRVQVNISSDSTAAQCAARLRTAILANQTTLEVTDNTDGTLTVAAPDLIMTITENVANAGFTVASAVMTVAKADGSMYVPLNYPVLLNGDSGPQVGCLRDSADGTATCTRVKKY